MGDLLDTLQLLWWRFYSHVRRFARIASALCSLCPEFRYFSWANGFWTSTGMLKPHKMSSFRIWYNHVEVLFPSLDMIRFSFLLLNPSWATVKLAVITPACGWLVNATISWTETLTPVVPGPEKYQKETLLSPGEPSREGEGNPVWQGRGELRPRRAGVR